MSKREIKELSEWLEQAEFTDDLSKDRLYRKLTHQLDHGSKATPVKIKEEISLKNRVKGIAAVLAAIVVIGGFSATTYAQDMLQSILAQFRVGNMLITQYDQELPDTGNQQAEKEKETEATRTTQPEPVHLSLQEARSATGLNFPAAAQLDEYNYVNTVIESDTMVQLLYQQGENMINLLISKGGQNGIGTTDEVKKEVINGIPVYFANGIVIWEQDGFTIELYSQKDVDAQTLGRWMKSMEKGAAVTPLHEEGREKLGELKNSRRAGPAPASAQ